MAPSFTLSTNASFVSKYSYPLNYARYYCCYKYQVTMMHFVSPFFVATTSSETIFILEHFHFPPWDHSHTIGTASQLIPIASREMIQMGQCSRKTLLFPFSKRNFHLHTWLLNMSPSQPIDIAIPIEGLESCKSFTNCVLWTDDYYTLSTYNLNEIRLFHQRCKPFLCSTIFLSETTYCYLLLLMKSAPPEPMFTNTL